MNRDSGEKKIMRGDSLPIPTPNFQTSTAIRPTLSQIFAGTPPNLRYRRNPSGGSALNWRNPDRRDDFVGIPKNERLQPLS